MIATDGHRLSFADVAAVAGKDMDMLIPLLAVRVLRRFCDDAGDDLAFTSVGPDVYFRSGSTVFSCKQTDAVFPPYAQIVPAIWDHEIRVNRAALVAALRATGVASSEAGLGSGVHLDVCDGKIALSASSPTAGDARDTVPVEYFGKPIATYFEPKYVLDVLTSLDEEDVSLRLSGELDPIYIVPASARPYSAIVMPMRPPPR